MESSEQVREHFRHPRHAGVFPATESDVITVRVGEPLRGGVIQLQLKIAEQRIIAVRQQVYGSAYLIAAASWLADWLTAKSLAEARQFDKRQLEDALQLPPSRLHCAVLAEQALCSALPNLDY